MLKIRDDVNLEELKRFGFKHKKRDGIETYELNASKNIKGYDGYSVDVWDRKLNNYCVRK